MALECRSIVCLRNNKIDNTLIKYIISIIVHICNNHSFYSVRESFDIDALKHSLD